VLREDFVVMDESLVEQLDREREHLAALERERSRLLASIGDLERRTQGRVVAAGAVQGDRQRRERRAGRERWPRSRP